MPATKSRWLSPTIRRTHRRASADSVLARVVDRARGFRNPAAGLQAPDRGGDVRLRGAGIIRCDEAVKDRAATVVELRWHALDPDSRPRHGRCATARSRAPSTRSARSRGVPGGSAPVRPPVHRAGPGRRRGRPEPIAITSTRIRAGVARRLRRTGRRRRRAEQGFQFERNGCSSPTATTTRPASRCSSP